MGSVVDARVDADVREEAARHELKKVCASSQSSEPRMVAAHACLARIQSGRSAACSPSAARSRVVAAATACACTLEPRHGVGLHARPVAGGEARAGARGERAEVAPVVAEGREERRQHTDRAASSALTLSLLLRRRLDALVLELDEPRLHQLAEDQQRLELRASG